MVAWCTRASGLTETLRGRRCLVLHIADASKGGRLGSLSPSRCTPHLLSSCPRKKEALVVTNI